MIYKIAELFTEVPEAGGLASRCREYRCDEEATADIVIREADYKVERYDSRYKPELIAYMESGWQFYRQLIGLGGLYIHSSAVVLDGKAYLFSGFCRAGKSTHTRLWQQVFGPAARVINDDKPALRKIDGIWYAYGTPWCGKDGININERAPVVGVCFMKKADHNAIHRLSQLEAMQKILSQTFRRYESEDKLDQMLGTLEQFLQEIPVYELENRPEPEAVRLSYETMCAGAQEAGL